MQRHPRGARRGRRQDDEIESCANGSRRPSSRRRPSKVATSSSRGSRDAAAVAPSTTSRAPTSSGCRSAVVASTTRRQLDVEGSAALPRRGPLRPREGQGAHRRVHRRPPAPQRQEGPDPVFRRSARRRQDVARPVDRARHGPRVTCASRSAACATRPRSAATGAPTSARCPGRIIQALKKVGTQQPGASCSTRSTRWASTSAAIRRRRCSRCSTPSRTRPSDHYLDRRSISRNDVPGHGEQPRHDPAPLCDRMEMIEVPGYTRSEKRGSRKEFLVPSSSPSTASPTSGSTSPTRASPTLIDHYTREAGVRGLERELAAVCRSTAVKLAEGDDVHRRSTAEQVEAILGPAEAPARASPSASSRRRGDGPRVDAGRWRDPLHRGDARCPARATSSFTGNMRQRDARVGARRRCRSCAAGAAAAASTPSGSRHRSAPARARGRHAQGRAQRRRDDVHRRRVAAPRLLGARATSR